MRNWTLALCFSAVGFGAMAEDVPGPKSTTSRPVMNISAPDEKAVRAELATIVEDAVIPQRFDQLMNQFSRLDRDGLDQKTPTTQTAPLQKLDAAITDFQKAWKDKYHQDFNLRGNETKVFDGQFAAIDVSEPEDASDKPKPPASAPSSLTSATGINTKPPQNPASAPSKKIHMNNRALASIPDSQASVAIMLELVQEGAVWKLDAPGLADSKAIQDALVEHLQALVKDQTKWPADQNEAYRMVARQAFSAILQATTRPGGDIESRAGTP